MNELLTRAGMIVEVARAKGADAARAGTHRVREVSLNFRDGNLETVSEATTRGAWLDLFVDGRYSQVQTSDLRPDALARFVAESVAMTRVLEKDPFRGLPDKSLYEGRPSGNLMVHDDGHEGLTADVRRRDAEAIEAAARSADRNNSIASVTASVSDTRVESARAASDGFQGACQRTLFSHFVEVSCKDEGGKRPEDWADATVRIRADLPSASQLGREATERALGRIGAKKGASGKFTMIVEPRAAGRLMDALLGPMSGYALQQKVSFLDGQLGKSIASSKLTIVDDPTLPSGIGTFPYDMDGFASKKRPIIEAGVLRAFFIDDYYARKLSVAPTTGGSSNLVFAAGAKGLEALCSDAKDAILVTSFLGGNSNGTTGDYSLGVAGYRIRGGKRAESVTEMNIAGNQRELWKRLVAVGSDPYPYANARTPTLVFENETFAGA